MFGCSCFPCPSRTVALTRTGIVCVCVCVVHAHAHARPHHNIDVESRWSAGCLAIQTGTRPGTLPWIRRRTVMYHAGVNTHGYLLKSLIRRVLSWFVVDEDVHSHCTGMKSL